MTTVKIPRKDLMDNEVTYEPVSEVAIETSRWSILYEIVFKWTDGKFYRTRYSVGATELQDERPWDYQDEVECEEVVEREVMVKQWVAV